MFWRCLFLSSGGTFLSNGWIFCLLSLRVVSHIFAGVFCPLPFRQLFHPRVGDSMRCVLTLHPSWFKQVGVFFTSPAKLALNMGLKPLT